METSGAFVLAIRVRAPYRTLTRHPRLKVE